MFVEFHDHLGNPQRVKATRVVVYDDFGTPHALAVSHARTQQVEQLFVSMLGQDDFQSLLRNLGINRTVILQDAAQRPLNEILFE